MRKAIDELAAENLVVRRQGKGTFVATHAEHHVQYRFLKLVPDSGDVDSEGPAEREIVDCRRQRASADVARALALRTGDAVLQVRRVLAYRGTPNSVSNSAYIGPCQSVKRSAVRPRNGMPGSQSSSRMVGVPR